ncbi:MAG: hypothetical protein ACOYN0_08815 [Phycisphaerales bacterium]
MDPRTKPTLAESARRNPGVSPDRVLQMQEVVRQLQDLGLLKPSKYGLRPGLSAPRTGVASSNSPRMMSRAVGRR